jgi:hypothetical protein
LADNKKVNFRIRSLLNSIVAISLLSPAALAQQSGTEETSQPQSIPPTPSATLQGKAEEKEAHLEGKLEQTAPLEGGLSDEQLKLRALNNALFGQNTELTIQASKDSKHAPLQGRLEQIGNPDAKLPVELTSKIDKNKAFADIQLIKQTPQFDVMPQPTLLKGNLTSLSTMTSFPDFVVGTWGGHLKILTRDVYKRSITDSRLAVDDLGTIVVRFIKEEDNVNVLPPSVFFQRRLINRKRHKLRREGDPDAVENLRPKKYNDYPIIDMGSKHWHNAVGGQWQDDVLHNSLQRIGENGAEQDTVFKRTKDGAPYGYRETVARYTWVTKNKILMQAAVVDFTMKRKVRKRTIMEGFIVPDWHPFAKEIGSIAELPWAQIVKIYDLQIDW